MHFIFQNMNLDFLPEDCFTHILSFTSASDACRVSLVSSMVRLTADSDYVWDKFVPPDYQEILSKLVHPVVYSSKKELFLRLCDPHLIDGGKKLARDNATIKMVLATTKDMRKDKTIQSVFSLEKSSKKRYMLSARELSIKWANNPLYWTWKSFSQSRFKDVAELRTICWLEIKGNINTRILSPKTVYGAYLIVKFAGRAYGLDSLPSEVSLEVGKIKSQGTVYLHHNQSKKKFLESTYYLNRIEALRSRKIFEGEGRVPCEREDGWIEIELGSFYNDGGDEEVNMCLKEVTGEHLKGGLIVEGIELRPKE